jgi:hypothetical protein
MGLLKSVERELMKYNVDLMGVQKARLQMLHTKVETSMEEEKDRRVDRTKVALNQQTFYGKGNANHHFFMH